MVLLRSVAPVTGQLDRFERAVMCQGQKAIFAAQSATARLHSATPTGA